MSLVETTFALPPPQLLVNRGTAQRQPGGDAFDHGNERRTV